MEHEFIAIPSGDYEAFCFDVPKEVWIKIKGEEPDPLDKSWFNKGYYRIYPNDLFPFLRGPTLIKDPTKVYKYKMSLEAEVVEEIPAPEDYDENQREVSRWREEGMDEWRKKHDI